MPIPFSDSEIRSGRDDDPVTGFYIFAELTRAYNQECRTKKSRGKSGKRTEVIGNDVVACVWGDENTVSDKEVCRRDT